MSHLFRQVLLKRSCVRMYQKLTVGSINPCVVRLEYAVRGPIVQRSVEIEQELKAGKRKEFKEIIKCNIGDCHASGQKPINFIRQVISAAANPSLLNSDSISDDAKSRAKRFLDSCGGSVGVYSQSTGVQLVREDVAKYITERDGIPADPKDIFLSTGASEAVKSLLQLIASGKEGKDRSGVMVPIPQYPLYSATNAEYNAYQIDYYLDEANQWGLNMKQLEDSIQKAKTKCIPRALVVINPGNPTGQLLPEATIAEVLQFAHRHNLLVLADEVYQHNVYAPGRKFVSFKYTLNKLGGQIAKEVQLASIMSCSKGYMGECGLRGGYCELINFDPDVQAQLYKCLSARLCSSLLGQLALDVVVNPPRPGEVSYESFNAEKQSVLDALKFKAELVTKSLNDLPGYVCNPIAGAMYAFPRLEIPQKAIEAAKKMGVEPDFLYCLEFLEKTGVCIVPGSGFGQLPGTWHFRITILPSVEKMKTVVEKLKQFHAHFLQKYS